jgi:hypothetical protein
MRLVQASALAVAAALLVPAALGAQDADRVVAGGGITAPGWMGKVDARAAGRGASVNDSKFMMMGSDIHAEIGPASIYWNAANTASGNYMVKATFKEAKMDAGHPHPAGIFIGGTDMDGAQKLVYCTVYGTGQFLVRQFDGATVTTPAAQQDHAAVHKAAADGSVTNEVAWRVAGDRAECLINGTVVAGFNRSELISTNGIAGLRFSHNMDVTVSGFTVTKN